MRNSPAEERCSKYFSWGFDCDRGTDVQISVDGLSVDMVNHPHWQGYADVHFNIPESITGIDGPYYADHGNLNTAGYVAFSMFVTTLNGSIVFIVTTVFHLRGNLPGKEFLCIACWSRYH